MDFETLRVGPQTDPANYGDSEAYCRARARENDVDAYLAALFAPAGKRTDLYAVQAFAGEMLRIPDLVHEAMLGEIRLQWWRDALDRLFARSAGTGHPVLAALARAHAQKPFARGAFDRLIDAQALALYDRPIATLADLITYAESSTGVLLSLQAAIIAHSSPPALLIDEGGRALGLSNFLRTLFRRRRAHHLLPTELVPKLDDAAAVSRAVPIIAAAAGEALQAARAASPVPADWRPVFSPLALVEPSLKRLEAAGNDAFAPHWEAPVHRRQLRLLAAAATGRI